MTLRSSPACVRKPVSPTSPPSNSSTCRDELCVELKALKLYLWSFRDRGAFHEAVTNQIADDLATPATPVPALIGKFNVRGGIYTTVVVRAATFRLECGPGGRIALIWHEKNDCPKRLSHRCTGKNSPV
jgi:hypothetical protein